MKDFFKEKHSRMSAILVLMTNHFLCNFQPLSFSDSKLANCPSLLESHLGYYFRRKYGNVLKLLDLFDDLKIGHIGKGLSAA